MLTIEFIPYHEIEKLSSLGRIKRLLKTAKENKIVLLEGRLTKEEEAELIKTTMEEINEEFKGIELAVIDPAKMQGGPMIKLKNNILDMLLGNRTGITIVGPASVVKAIRKDPTKIQLFTRDVKKKKKR
jgi:hypothetical protein